MRYGGRYGWWMAGYTKLFPSLVNSTIWRADDKTRLVWITMLALADRDGIVEASLPGLADAARVSIAECERALGILMSPDEYSRTKDHEGRRVAEVDGGWHLLNHGKYRAKMSAEVQREKAAIRQRNFRLRKKGKPLPGESAYDRALRTGDAATAERMLDGENSG